MSGDEIRSRIRHDRYEVISVIGSGGMGTVYRALRRSELGGTSAAASQTVALKTIRGTADPKRMRMFQNEVGILGSLSHPYIVDIFDSGVLEEDGEQKPFFVMPLLPGRSLDKILLDAQGQLPLDYVLQLTSQICQGLHAAHERNVIHRDLKPANIFVIDGPAVKIIDFGVGHLVDDNSSVTGIKGTLAYMAPEQLRTGQCSASSDQFSMGVVLYEMLAGRRPFNGRNEAELIQGIIEEAPSWLASLNPSVPVVIGQIVHRMLAKQPSQRFSSLREVADLLDRFSRGTPVVIFDPAKIEQRIELAKKAEAEGDSQLALEILTRLESEGGFDPASLRLKDEIARKVRLNRQAQKLQQANLCFSQGAYDDALLRVQEVLESDKDNVTARALEREISKKRQEQNIAEWLRLAKTHLEARHFDRANEELNRVLQAAPSHLDGLRLQQEVEQRESEYQRVQQEKEHLFESAVAAWNSGDVARALSRVERVVELDAQSPDVRTSERSARYKQLYNDVSSVNNALRAAEQEAQTLRDQKQFKAALEVCAKVLREHPHDSTFIALNLDIEERQRQDLSELIGQIGGQLRTEPSLEKRIELLRKALERYPEEPYFQKRIEDTQKTLDALRLMVSKARFLEDEGQFEEAAHQWDSIATLHPSYPALDAERARVRERRDRQLQANQKGRRVEEVNQALKQGDYARALKLIGLARAEFPGDRELEVLEKQTQHVAEKAHEARNLLESGQAKAAEASYDSALEDLRKAVALDENSRVAKRVLVDTLVSAARDRLETDSNSAGQLLSEAAALEPNNPAIVSARMMLADREQDQFVQECAAKARSLQASGELGAAMKEVDAALERYPKDPTLLRIRQELIDEKRRVEGRERRQADIQRLQQFRDEAASATASLDPQERIEHTLDIGRRHQSDPEIVEMVTQVASSIQNAAKPAAATPVAPPPPLPPLAKPDPVAQTKSPPKPDQPKKPAEPGFLAQFMRNKVAVAGAAGVAALLAIGLFVSGRQKPAPPPPPPPPPKLVTEAEKPKPPEPPVIAFQLLGGAITLDGKPVTDREKPFEIGPGPHELSLKDRADRTYSATLEISPEGSVTVTNAKADPRILVTIAAVNGSSVKVFGPQFAGPERSKITPVSAENPVVLPAGANSISVAHAAPYPYDIPISATDRTSILVYIKDTTESLIRVCDLPPGGEIELAATGKKEPNRKAAAGKDGCAQINPVPVGRYRLTARAKGYTTQEQDIAVEFGTSPVRSVKLGFTMGEVEVVNHDPGSELVIDGVSRGQLRGERPRFQLDPGPHRFQLKLRNYDSAAPTTIQVPGGGVAQFDARGKLTRTQFRVRIQRSPAHAVLILKRPQGDQRIQPSQDTLPLPAGRYEFVLRADLHESTGTTIDVGEGLQNTISLRLKPLTVASVPPPAVVKKTTTTSISGCLTGKSEPGGFTKVSGGSCGPFPGSFSFTAKRQKTLGVAKSIDWAISSGSSSIKFKLDKSQVTIGAVKKPVKADQDNVAVAYEVQAKRVECSIEGTRVTFDSSFDLTGSVLTMRDEAITGLQATVQAK